MTRRQPEPPRAVRWITRLLEEAGFETWAVGGAVRDALLGHPSGDWDLATRARPEEVRRTFRRTVPIGVEHGTVGVLAPDGVMYEVTTFRRDVETDGRHAVVSFADTVEEDLARRDFTINAMAWHALREELLDPFGGAGDLAEGILRTVGTPSERFREDYLRILRAFRFAGRFGLRIDTDTWTAAAALVAHLQGLSAERIREELIKVLEADPAPSRALELYRASGAAAVLYPELEALDGETWKRTLAAVDALPRGRPYLRLALLLSPLDPREGAQVLVRARLSNALTQETALRAGAPPMPPTDAEDATLRRWLSRVGVERLPAVARLELARARAGDGDVRDVVKRWCALRRVRALRPPLSVGDLAVDGRDLIGRGLKPGPHFGRILDALLDQVLADPGRNRKDVLLEEALRLAETDMDDGGGTRMSGASGRAMDAGSGGEDEGSGRG